MPNFCPKRKFIFIHIPRTAGGSMEKSINCSGGNSGGIKLYNHRNGHAKLSWYPRAMIQDFFKFSIIRNPWDRIFSVYKWNRADRSAPLSKDAFESFLVKRKESPNSTTNWHCGFLNQLDYLTYKGSLSIDFLIRFENLQKDFAKFQGKYPFIAVNELPHVHKTKTAAYRNYYTDSTCNMVGELFEKDISYFKYQF